MTRRRWAPDREQTVDADIEPAGLFVGTKGRRLKFVPRPTLLAAFG